MVWAAGAEAGEECLLLYVAEEEEVVAESIIFSVTVAVAVTVLSERFVIRVIIVVTS